MPKGIKLESKWRRAIRLYKDQNPEATYREMQLEFFKKIGRKVSLGQLSNILKERDDFSLKVVAEAKKMQVKKAAKELLQVIETRHIQINEIEAKIITKLHDRLDSPDHISSPELMKMWKDITDIRGKIQGMVEVQGELSPDHLNKFKHLLDQIDEQINCKTNIRITAIAPQRLGGNDSGRASEFEGEG